MATWMAHPEVTEPALVADAAFAEVWGPRGWEPVTVDPAAAFTLTGQPLADPAALDVATVRQLLADARSAETPAEPAPKKTKTTSAATPAANTSEG